VCLRLTILAIPPVIAQIQVDLGLSATQVGLLNSLPAAMFALAALPGSLLIAALGTRRTLIVGLLVVACGSALRGLSGHGLTLFVTTALMGAGVAMMQPAMPSVARYWVPERIGLATAVYTNGLLAGEVFPVVLTAPLLLFALAGNWREALVFWSVPVALVAGIVFFFAPATPPAAGLAVRHRPNWKSGMVWRLALLFGSVNGLYFATNAFLPGYCVSRGEAFLISPALSALNFGQIPASFLLLVFAQRLERRAWPFHLAGGAGLVGLAGIVCFKGLIVVAGAALVGFGCATCLILALTLPALLCPPSEVAVTSAAVFTVSYTSAVMTAVASGLAWDLSGAPWAAFIPLALCAALIGASPLLLVRRRELR
jgi:CP family cyanate transporter-like MFS transporter